MRLTRNMVRAYCDTAVFTRGKDIYASNKITSMRAIEDEKGMTIEGSVRGTSKEPYNVKLFLRDLNHNDCWSITDYYCDCPASVNRYGMCKHCVAVGLAYIDAEKSKSKTTDLNVTRMTGKVSDGALQDVLQRYSAYGEAEADVKPGSMRVELEFDIVSAYYGNQKRVCASIKAGADRLYVIKSIPTFIHSILHGTQYEYGKKLSVRHAIELFEPVSQQIIQVLTDVVREYKNSVDSRASYVITASERDRIITLNNHQAAKLFDLAREQDGIIHTYEKNYKCREGDPRVTLNIEAVSGGAYLTVPTLTCLCHEPKAVYTQGENAYFCTEAFQKYALPFLHGIGATEDKGSEVKRFLSESDFGRFTAYVLPKLKKVMDVDEGEVDFEAYKPREPEFNFYLSKAGKDTIGLRAEVLYGDTAYPLETCGTEYRNKPMERPAVEAVANYFPDKNARGLREVSDEDAVYRLLTEGLDCLRKLGSVLIDDSLRNLRVAPSPTPTVGIALHGSLIDISLESEGYSPAEINAILDAYKLKKKYYRLKNGEFLSLTEGGLSVVGELADGIDLKFDKDGKAQTPAFRAAYINAMLDNENTDVDIHRDAAFKSQIMALKNYRDESREIPAELHATLRGYQKSGYRWLCALSSCGLGGILADDMGLGKTVQMLAYFLHLGGSFLVVCPASLVYNWESECRKFAPSIACHIMRGTEEERKRQLKCESGLTITSYDRLLRDIEMYKNKHFDCCVLDEAQYIRNAGTKTAKAVKRIQADHRFALTGTPIENRLSDLWSIFDFLMSGYLFKYPEFRSRVEQPAVNGETVAKERLTRLTTPFILRRKKADVLKELPDKLESVVYVEMTDAQRQIYNAQEQALRLTLQNTPDSEFLHQKIEYLSALTRLRQICCTPELFLENYTGGSGKIDTCMELLASDAESGHRTLVFSQFTSMLELLIDRAEQLGLKYLYLSGKNTSEQRRDMVEQFQSGEYSVFFISLKAGGTGLNLTAADRVLHFDPWWNIAAETQATDRAHRIGQKNKVLVTKLVCKDTVEERIIDLQQRKRALSDMVTDDESVRAATLDRAAILELLQGAE